VVFINAGGIRAELAYGTTYGNEAPGQVTYGEAFAVQPFGNMLMTMTLTGTQILSLLEQQWCVAGEPRNGLAKMFSVSDGFAYSWNAQKPACGGRVVPGSVRVGGIPLSASTPYRVTVSDFMAEGADSFSIFSEGTNLVFRAGIELDAFLQWLAGHPAATIPQGERITCVVQ